MYNQPQKKVLREAVMQIQQQIDVQPELPVFFVMKEETIVEGFKQELKKFTNPYDALSTALTNLSTNPSYYISPENVDTNLIISLAESDQQNEEFVSDKDKETKEVITDDVNKESFNELVNRDVLALTSRVFHGVKNNGISLLDISEEEEGDLDEIQEGEVKTQTTRKFYEIENKDKVQVEIVLEVLSEYRGEKEVINTDRGNLESIVPTPVKNTLKDVFYHQTSVLDILSNENLTTLNKIINQ